MNKNKIYAFHELGHIHGRKAGASIDLILKEGVKSVSTLVKEGRLESYSEKFLKFKDNPKSEVLQKYFPFQIPGTPVNREENVFFSPLETLPNWEDFVVIEVSPEEKVYNSFWRDDNNLEAYLESQVPVSEYMALRKVLKNPYSSQEMERRGRSTLFQTYEFYPEILKKDFFPAHKILAYAKLEKEFLYPQIPAHQEEKIVKKLDYIFDFCTFFKDGKNSILQYDGLIKEYKLRIVFDKEKSFKNKDKISALLNQIHTFKDIYTLARNKKNLKRTIAENIYRKKSLELLGR
ncbi:MAG: hypothetical protein PHI50_00555 [Alphaproteobacteria bacterium]|nr:hypothetical protein [Alphaproteobacteria bacterium]